MLFDVGQKIGLGLPQGIRDTLEDLTDFGRCTVYPRFTEPTKSFVVGPQGCLIERQRQTILRQVDGRGDYIVYRRKMRFTEHVVIDNTEIFEVSIAVA